MVLMERVGKKNNKVRKIFRIYNVKNCKRKFLVSSIFFNIYIYILRRGKMEREW